MLSIVFSGNGISEYETFSLFESSGRIKYVYPGLSSFASILPDTTRDTEIKALLMTNCNTAAFLNDATCPGLAPPPPTTVPPSSCNRSDEMRGSSKGERSGSGFGIIPIPYICIRHRIRD